MNRERKKNVLVVCEGQDDELLFKTILKYYPIDANYETYIYKTNIHLFSQYLFRNFLNKQSSINDLDMLQVLKEYRYDKVLDNKYTDILFVFDYDPQDPRFDGKTLQKMLQIFSESTDQGQLYINYPMVESAIDFTSLPESDYNKKTCSLNDLKFNGYKNKVKRNSILKSIDAINDSNLYFILYHTFEKMKFLTNNNTEDYELLLSVENNLFKQKKISMLYVQVYFF